MPAHAGIILNPLLTNLGEVVRSNLNNSPSTQSNGDSHLYAILGSTDLMVVDRVMFFLPTSLVRSMAVQYDVAYSPHQFPFSGTLWRYTSWAIIIDAVEDNVPYVF